MFQVKPMTADDFQFATALANTMDWNMATEDFQFMKSLEPEGCLVALQDSERLGIATSISFSNVGWFGNLIVEQKYRNKGIGRLLVKHAVNYLLSKGVKTVGLYAYPHLTGFYGSLGFKFDEDFVVLKTEALSDLVAETRFEEGSKEIQAIEKLDSQCFGGERKKLLESIILQKSNLSYCKKENGALVGFVAATVYEKMAWVGPLLCKSGRADIAVSLVKAVLNKLTGLSVYAVLPKKENFLIELFSGVGFKEDFFVSRMFLGRAIAKNCIYMAESLERG